MKRVVTTSLYLVVFFSCCGATLLRAAGQTPVLQTPLMHVHLRARLLQAVSRQAIRSATVRVCLQSDSSLVKGAISSVKGEIDIEIPAHSKYIAFGKRVGMTSFSRVFETFDQDVDLGDILMQESAVVTGEVEVSGWREFTEVRPDKRVYTVADNPNIVAATTASQVLDQIPTVYVDETGTVRLRGTDPATIMVNGRELKMEQSELNNYLQGLVADNVQAIEVKSAGTAKDDAKRAAGSINIITRKSLGDRIGGRIYGNISSNESMGSGASMYYSDSSVSASLGIGAQRERQSTHADFARHTPPSAAFPSLTKSVVEDVTLPGYHIDPQIDIQLSPKDLLSISGTAFTNPENHWESRGYGARNLSNGDTVENILDTSHTFRRIRFGDVSVLYKRRFSESQSLNLSVGYSNWAARRNEYKSSVLRTLDGKIDTALSLFQDTHGDDASPNVNINLDYTWDVSKSWQLQSGMKTELERQSSSIVATRYDFVSNATVIDTAASIDLHSKANLMAFYVNSQVQVNDDFSVQAGLRYETSTLGATFSDTTIERTYPALFPSVSLSYVLSPEATLSASYARGVDLPWVGALNPRTVRETATSVSTGNPDIRPEFMHNIELSLQMSWKRTTLTIAPFYIRTLDEVMMSGHVEGEVIHTTRANFNSAYNLGMHTSFTHRTSGGLSINAWLMAQFLSNVGSAIPGDLASSSANAKGNISLSYELIHGFTLAASTRYNSEYTYGGDHSYDNVNMNISSMAKLFNDAMTINLALSDPLDIRHTKRLSSAQDYSLSMYHKPTTRILSLNLSYRLGNDRVKLEQHNQDKSNKGE